MGQTQESYLKPEVIQSIGRLDLKAKFIVEGFISGLHKSPYHGFSVEFSEHRKYVRGDPPKTIDWRLFGRTDKLYIKKFEAETNLQCHLIVDTSKSMDYGRGGTLSKLDYAICVAASLGYLLIHQQDPVGLALIDEKLQAFLEPKTKLGHLTDILSVLTNAQAGEKSDLAAGLRVTASLINRRGLIMIISDLYQDEAQDEELLDAIHELRYRGHDVILFHVLDQSETTFDFNGPVTFTDCETGETITIDAGGLREGYLEEIAAFRKTWEDHCLRADVDWVPLDTGMPFDRALVSFLTKRIERF